jgi:Co/Zn/Cd efflux system component
VSLAAVKADAACALEVYADPGVSMGISLMILVSALPLVKNSGAILLQSAPRGLDLGDVKHDLEKVRASSSPRLRLFDTSRFLALNPFTSCTCGDSTRKRLSHQR